MAKSFFSAFGEVVAKSFPPHAVPNPVVEPQTDEVGGAVPPPLRLPVLVADCTSCGIV